VGADLLGEVQALARRVGELVSPSGLAAGCHCAVVAEVPQLAGQLVRSAVLADLQAGASWAQIGEGPGISGEAARARFGRMRTSEPATARGG
jgi:hypothetical protein